MDLTKEDLSKCKTCDECNVVMRFGIQTVVEKWGSTDENPMERHYCKTHKKPYDLIISSGDGSSRYFIRSAEVNNEGKLIKE